MHIRQWVSCILFSVLLLTSLTAPPAIRAIQPSLVEPPNSTLIFIENIGQFPAKARFYAPAADRTFWLTSDALWMTTTERGQTVNLKLSFPGANPAPRLEAFNRLETVVSYYRGQNPANWQTNAPTWGGVRYVDLYPGVDLEIATARGQLSWRLACRADCKSTLRQTRLLVEGSEAVTVRDGYLHLTTAGGNLELPLLSVTSNTLKGQPEIVKGEGHSYAVVSPFAAPIPNPQFANSLRSQDHLSDRIYSTYFGGSGNDGVSAIAVDGDGVAYLTGQTFSTDLPITPGVVDTSTDGNEAFIAKMNPDGTALAYLTYLGGSDAQGGNGVDYGTAIAVDDDGAAYVAGWTNSADFPVTLDAFQPALKGSDPDAFVVVLSPDGTTLRYSTYLGGSANDKIGYLDEGNPIAVGGDGAIYVVGTTFSSDFPSTSGALDPTYNRYPDAFVTVFKPDGSLRYSTFLGGSDSNDYGNGIAVAADGAAYVTGETNSVDFPVTPSAFQTSLNDLYSTDVFVTILAPNGSSLRYSTYLGGAEGDEKGYGIAVGSDGAAYVTGETLSDDFPTTPGVLKPASTGAASDDAFVAVLDPGASGNASLRCATYLGSDTSWDRGNDLALTNDNAIYIAGVTASSDFTTTAGAFQNANAGNWDSFVAILSPDCAALRYATYLGGADGDTGYTVAIGADGSAYVAGGTYSHDFPTSPDAFQPTFSGGSGSHPTDGFVARLRAEEAAPNLAASTKRVNPDAAVAGQVVTFTVRLVNSGVLSASVAVTDTLSATLILRGTPASSSGAAPSVNGQTLTWVGTVTNNAVVTLTYATLLTSTTEITPTTVNTAQINDGIGNSYLRRAFVNGYYVFLPLVLRNQ